MDATHGVISSLKLLVLGVTAGLVVMFGILIALGFGFTRSATLWIALPLVVGLADIVLVPSVGSTVRPLPYGASVADARRISAQVLRTVTTLRFALAEAAALFGFASAFLAGSLLPYAIGFAFAVPLLLVFAYPSTRVVRVIQSRLESSGVSAGFTAAPGRQP